MEMQPEAAAPAPVPAAPAPEAPPTPPVAPIQPAWQPRVNARWLNIVLVIAGAFAIAGIAFAIGRSTAPSALDQLRADGLGGRDGQFFVGPGGQGGFPGQGGQGGQGGGRLPLVGTGGGLAIEGTVESIDGDSITIKTADGRSIELSIDGDTSYHTASDASASAVTSGSKVVVRVQAGGGQPGGGQPGSGGGFDLGADDVTVLP